MSQFRAPGIWMILRQTSCWMKNLFLDLKPYSIWKLLSGSQGTVSLNRFKPTDYKEYLDTFTICLKITSVSCRQNAFTRIAVLWIGIKNNWTLRSNHTCQSNPYIGHETDKIYDRPRMWRTRNWTQALTIIVLSRSPKITAAKQWQETILRKRKNLIHTLTGCVTHNTK